MKKGDKVYLKNREEVTGEIIDTKLEHIWGNTYIQHKVKYDKTDLIPPEDWHDVEHLVLIPELPKPRTNTGCECGVSIVMPNGKHSSYCPLYREE